MGFLDSSAFFETYPASSRKTLSMSADLHYSPQEHLGERPAHFAAESCLHVFEKHLEVARDLPDLIEIKAETVALFAATSH